jgi:hypothetical protein
MFLVALRGGREKAGRELLMMRKRSARLLTVGAVTVLALAPFRAASATTAPTQTVDGFAIDASLNGVATGCLNQTTGEWSVAWNFSVTSPVNGFSVTAKSANAGGLILTTQAQRAVYPAGPARTITFAGSKTYFGRDAVTQTVTYDLLVSTTAARDGKLVATAPIAATIASPCTTSASIATTTTTISTTACSCTPDTVKDPGVTTTSPAATTAVLAASPTVLQGTVSGSGTTVAVLAAAIKQKALPRTGGNIGSLLATAGAFVAIGVTLAALPSRRTRNPAE